MQGIETGVSERVYFEVLLSDVVPCWACESRGETGSAVWIVSNRPRWGHEVFLCDPCLQQWLGFGFGVKYETGARWERI